MQQLNFANVVRHPETFCEGRSNPQIHRHIPGEAKKRLNQWLGVNGTIQDRSKWLDISRDKNEEDFTTRKISGKIRRCELREALITYNVV